MSDLFLDERFDRAALDPRLTWLNPPRNFQLASTTPALVVEPEGKTDFWKQTHYGFSAASGHFLGLTAPDSFTISTRLRFHPVHQYDQAGLMVWVNEDSWIKTSVEHELDRPPQLGVVVTQRGFSDWSLQDFPGTQPEVELRIQRTRSDVMVEYRLTSGETWKTLRVAHLDCGIDQPVRAGLYACCPKEAGFRAEFAFLKVGKG